jgi:phosphatidylserine/phosphatidylglycerophosphate/cardiolipin synthase-like enzyme
MPPREAATRRGIWIAAAIGFGLGLIAAAEGLRWLRPPLPAGAAQTCFTPPEDCTDLLESEIASARRQVLMQAYSFTSRPIAEALIAARRRGVEVLVIMDSAAVDANASVAGLLAAAGIPVLADNPPGIAHNKVVVIDGERVVTGSFNFTRAAEDRNAENLLVLHSPELAAVYVANWERRRAVSAPAARRER